MTVQLVFTKDDGVTPGNHFLIKMMKISHGRQQLQPTHPTPITQSRIKIILKTLKENTSISNMLEYNMENMTLFQKNIIFTNLINEFVLFIPTKSLLI